MERVKRTVDITTSTVEIEEQGVKLKLTVVDTPGVGDAVDTTERFVVGEKIFQVIHLKNLIQI